jgi:hypothetical protein
MIMSKYPNSKITLDQGFFECDIVACHIELLVLSKS